MHPALVKHCLFPLHERLLQRPTFAELSRLEKSQWLPREEIERQQMQALTALLRTSLTHSPWHAERIRAAGLDGTLEKGLTLADFRRLPTMNKADAAANRDRLVWTGVPGGAYRYNTGGSSGQPLIFYFGRARQAADAACRMRARHWWGVDIGEPEVFLWGSPIEIKGTDRIKSLRDRLFNQLLLNAFEMSEATIQDYLEKIEAFDPACIYGYASSLQLLATYARNRGCVPRLKRLKVVCTTGEPLFSEQRQVIQEVFGVPLANEYGCRDGGLIALESPEGQMLVNSESILLEALDPEGNPVAPGDLGEAVVTNLCSEAQPFIRYRTGDMVRLSDQPCRAGRGLPVVREIMGRTTDFVVRPDGAVMHALALIYVLRAVEGVGEFKIIQWSAEHLELLIRPTASWTAAAGAVISHEICRRMGQPVEVDLKLVENIAPEASGKYRYVVSHARMPDALRLS